MAAQVPEVPQVSDPAKEPKKMRRFTEVVSNIINALQRRGQIVKEGPADYSISGASGGLTPGTYTNATVVVGVDGEITSVATGSGGGGGINAWEAPFTKPVLAGVTQVNTTGFTSSDDTNGLFVWRSGSLSASDNLCLTHIPVPASGGWSLTIRIQGLWGDDAFACGGAHLYEAATGKVITWSNQGTTATQRLCINYFTSVTAFSSQAKTIQNTERVTWLMITYDGTANYSFWWSMDGFSFVQFGPALSKTANFTTGASHAGFFLDPNTANCITGVKCMSLTCL